jgi:hypothetical protein
LLVVAALGNVVRAVHRPHSRCPGHSHGVPRQGGGIGRRRVSLFS